ncbi:MAG TPA: hypothetical protein VIH35_04625, partial [Kiritimatiellia bacterium]
MGQVYYTLFRRWRLIAICFGLGLLAALGVYLTTPTVFRSESKLLVRYVTDTTVLDPAATGGRVLTPERYADNIINSEVEILASRDLAESVVDDLGVSQFSDESNRVDRLAAVLTITRGLHIEVPRRSNVIRLYYDANTPALAQNVAASLVSHYLRKHIEIHRAAGAYDFLAQQTDQIRARLADTEEELRRLKNDAGVVSVEETKRSLLVRIEDLNRAYQDAEGELASTEAKLNIIHPSQSTNETADAGKVVTNDPSGGVARLYDNLSRLQDKEMELLATYTEDSILVQNLRVQIEDVKRQIGISSPGVRGYVDIVMPVGSREGYIAEEANLAGTKARIDVIKQQIADTREQARKLDEIEGRIVILDRTKQIQEANYKYFSQSLEQARIDDALDAGKITNISIVQPATYPAERFRPDLMRNLAAAVGLGLALGIGLAFLGDRILDHSVKRPSEVEGQLKLPVLMCVPRIVVNGKSAGAAPAGVHGGLDPYFETLRDRVLSSIGTRPARGPCLIGVTACARGAGVTTTASGLALMLARNGEERVLLLDADPAGGAPEIFGVKPTVGATDIVPGDKGRTAIIARNLFYLAPESGQGETALAHTRGFNEIVLSVRDDYAYVVIDLPPVTETSATLRIAGILHGLVMVIESEKDH